MLNKYGQVQGESQTSPFTNLPSYNQPAGQSTPTNPNQARQRQVVNNAISNGGSGLPGNGTPFGGAMQTLANAAPGIAGLASQQSGMQSTGSTTQPQKQEQGAGIGAASAPTGPSGGSNVDRFKSLLNDPKYKDNPQGAIDAFNSLGLDADSSGLSSHYGSSPAFYNNGLGQIGLPGSYLVKQSDGSWQETQRSPQQGGGGGNAAQNTINQLGAAPTLNGNDSNGIWQQIVQALNVDPRLAQAAKTFTS